MVESNNWVYSAPTWQANQCCTTAQTVLEEQDGVRDEVDGNCERVTWTILEERGAFAAVAVQQARVMMDAKGITVSAWQAAQNALVELDSNSCDIIPVC